LSIVLLVSLAALPCHAPSGIYISAAALYGAAP